WWLKTLPFPERERRNPANCSRPASCSCGRFRNNHDRTTSQEWELAVPESVGARDGRGAPILPDWCDAAIGSVAAAHIGRLLQTQTRAGFVPLRRSLRRDRSARQTSPATARSLAPFLVRPSASWWNKTHSVAEPL